MLFLLVLSALVATSAASRAARVSVAIGGSDPTCTGSARFEGAEHRCLSNAALITILTGNSTTLRYVNASIDTVTFRTPVGVSLGSYGDIVAMAGDFFAPDDLNTIICNGDTPANRSARFFRALATLDSAPQNAVDLIREEFDKELAAIKRNNTAIAWQVYRQFSFARFLFELAASVFPGFAQDVYTRLIFNWDHFGACGRRAYSTCHDEALKHARAAGNTMRAALADGALSDAQKDAAVTVGGAALMRAYYMNAFGDHFGTDQFAAGHLRTPRPELVNFCSATPGGLQANYMHDEDNRNGLPVKNGRGNRWVFYGDSNFFDPRNVDNIHISRAAVQASRDDVIAAFQGLPTAPLDQSPFLQYVPDPDDTNPQTTCPLFRLNNGVLEQRDDVLRQSAWRADTTARPPVDSSVVVCPVSPSPVPVCSYRVMTQGDCPGGIELLFAKQSFVDPAKFGARTLCYDDNQRSYVVRYGNASLSTGAIVGIAIGCAAFVAIIVLLIVLCINKGAIACCGGTSSAKAGDFSTPPSADVEMKAK